MDPQFAGSLHHFSHAPYAQPNGYEHMSTVPPSFAGAQGMLQHPGPHQVPPATPGRSTAPSEVEHTPAPFDARYAASPGQGSPSV